MPKHTSPKHIGIVACSAEGAALCYRTICVEGAALLGPHAHPEVSMHTPSLADYMRPEDVAFAIVTVLAQPRRVRTTLWSLWSMGQQG